MVELIINRGLGSILFIRIEELAGAFELCDCFNYRDPVNLFGHHNCNSCLLYMSL